MLAVSSYNIDHDKLKVFRRTLCMNFVDITDDIESSAFNKYIADEIVAYVKDLPKQLDTLLVCCDSGEFGSIAMSATIMRHNGMDEIMVRKNPHYHLNMLVYLLLCDALDVFCFGC